MRRADDPEMWKGLERNIGERNKAMKWIKEKKKIIINSANK